MCRMESVHNIISRRSRATMHQCAHLLGNFDDLCCLQVLRQHLTARIADVLQLFILCIKLATQLVDLRLEGLRAVTAS